MNAAAPRRLPLVRAECENGPRPCPHVTCRHHLDSRFASCSLDIADRGPVSVREVARLLGISRIRVEQAEHAALRSLYRVARLSGLSKADAGGFLAVSTADENGEADSEQSPKTHVCLSCHKLFMSPERNETQRLFCGPACRGEKPDPRSVKS